MPTYVQLLVKVTMQTDPLDTQHTSEKTYIGRWEKVQPSKMTRSLLGTRKDSIIITKPERAQMFVDISLNLFGLTPPLLDVVWQCVLTLLLVAASCLVTRNGSPLLLL